MTDWAPPPPPGRRDLGAALQEVADYLDPGHASPSRDLGSMTGRQLRRSLAPRDYDPRDPQVSTVANSFLLLERFERGQVGPRDARYHQFNEAEIGWLLSRDSIDPEVVFGIARNQRALSPDTQVALVRTRNGAFAGALLANDSVDLAPEAVEAIVARVKELNGPDRDDLLFRLLNRGTQLGAHHREVVELGAASKNPAVLTMTACQPLDVLEPGQGEDLTAALEKHRGPNGRNVLADNRAGRFRHDVQLAYQTGLWRR